mmetsp:Transcript_22142/g.53653  ORF Transcript_22142/g.53653 Transcript_22142/m.53653 type:complete len:794 (-) Transcript_22142:1127-3508(-)
MMMRHHRPSPRRPAHDSSMNLNRRGRRRRRLSLALALSMLSGETLSLMLPSQQFMPSSSIQPNEMICCHRWRKKTLSGLQLQLSSNHENYHLISSDNPSRFPLACLKNQFQICMPFSYPTIHNKQQFIGMSRRKSTSLLAQSSESSGSLGEDEDKKKKRDNSGSDKPKKSSKPKKRNHKENERGQSSGVSVTKGTSASGDTGANKRADNKTKRTRRKNSKQTNKKQKNKGARVKGKGKAKAKSNHHSSTLNTSKSSIRTSGENTSLKGFKSRVRHSPAPQIEQKPGETAKVSSDESSVSDDDLLKRVVQLEMIVSNQMTEIQKLRRDIEDLTKASEVFSNVVNVLREAGLRIDEDDAATDEEEESGDGDKDAESTNIGPLQQQQAIHDDMAIFGIAPKSVTDAADAAGASILSAILAGKHRMLVDVRDAELTRDPKLFVEFIELAVLPVAAGLEGLDGDEYVRNRVKIIFPTVKELMSYRRSMALAAPDVVSLSTLGFDPVDERDNLIVVIAPSPDDMAGVIAMERLIARTEQNYVEPDQRITQPVVVMNHHMMPVDMGGFGKFTSVYHLRLLSVQYMTGDAMPEYVAKGKSQVKSNEMSGDIKKNTKSSAQNVSPEAEKQNSNSTGTDGKEAKNTPDRSDEEDAALEAAMTHAHEIGVHQGITRAMVIRAYPKPWHVFVDTSPDTDADFEVAATFDIEPTQEDVNYAIVECLEGSEREDEIVAQQMQAALESGQLNRVSDMLGISPSDIVTEDKAASSETNDSDDDNNPNREYDGNDWDDLYYDDWFSEDSV